MKVGNLTPRKIDLFYHVLEVTTDLRYIMYEHNDDGEEIIIVVDTVQGCYCYTYESLAYTVRNKDDEYLWYKLNKKA